MKNKKPYSIVIITLIYLFVIGAGVGIYFLFPDVLKSQTLLMLLILYIVCTLLIYLFSCIFKNASIYDPYWSVIPPIAFIGFVLVTKLYNIYVLIFLILVAIWSIRLTLNWALNFKNLNVQDWRYQGFKDKHPKTFFLINLFGIHLFPTFIVFIGMLPGFYFIEKAVTTQLNVATIIGFVVMLFATIIELISDIQLFNFRKKGHTPGAILNTGLWKYSRHPNYFGEILFWISIWLVYFSAETSMLKGLVLAFCPIAIFVMFVFISIPMIEKRQLKNKPQYKEYMDCTNSLLIYPLLKNKK
jgi:steroid 5-alpha reductase family enzyme